MPKAPHAVERVPQDELATLSQLKELVSMMDAYNPKLTKTYMQDFLRLRLVPKPITPMVTNPIPQTPNRGNEMLENVDALCRKYHPHIANEVLELFEPWCDPELSLEFRHLDRPQDDYTNEMLVALPWVRGNSDQTIYHHINPSSRGNTLVQLREKRGNLQRIEDDIAENVLSTERQARRNLDAHFGLDAAYIVQHTLIYEHIESLFRNTGAYKYGLIEDAEITSLTAGIKIALSITISFLAVGDGVRANTLKPFLKWQRSGIPVLYRKENWVYLICI